jgi:hypothetical protein
MSQITKKELAERIYAVICSSRVRELVPFRKERFIKEFMKRAKEELVWECEEAEDWLKQQKEE